jgi:hypothetical protein
LIYFIPATLVVGFTTGGCIFEVFQFWQRISRLSDSLWFYLFALCVSKAIGTKGFGIIVLTCLPCAAACFHLLLSPQLLVLTAMSRVSLSGIYVNFPAKIFINPSKPESVLSTQFSCYHNTSQIYQITAHKIQISDKFNQAVQH